MFQVIDSYDEAKKILGTCSEKTFYRNLTDAVSLIANKGDFEGWKGFIDICVDCKRCITLPREVETVLAVNINGKPTLGKSQLFSFHLNGPGDCCTGCDWSWQDDGYTHAVYRDIEVPAKLIAYLDNPADEGKLLEVHGFDINGTPLSRVENGVRKAGYRVPTIFGYALPDDEAPVVARIVHVLKDETIGPVRLSTIDDSGITGILLAVYEPSERVPQYRRIKLLRPATWARIAYRRTNPVLTTKDDRIPLKSRTAFLMALRALKYYLEVDLGNAHAYEADAVRMELEAQQTMEPLVYMPVQVIDRNSLKDHDFDIR